MREFDGKKLDQTEEEKKKAEEQKAQLKTFAKPSKETREKKLSYLTALSTLPVYWLRAFDEKISTRVLSIIAGLDRHIIDVDMKKRVRSVSKLQVFFSGGFLSQKLRSNRTLLNSHDHKVLFFGEGNVNLCYD